MSSPLASLIGHAAARARRARAESSEPLRIAARNGWQGREHIRGDGYSVQALHLGPVTTPGRIDVRPIPQIGVGAGVLDPEPPADTGPAGHAVLRFEFAQPCLIRDLDLGLLFDGPEYADWEDVARFDVTFAGERDAQTFTLFSSYVNAGFAACSWDGSPVPWTSSGIWSGGPGSWLNTDPFGGRAVQRFDLHACTGSRASPAYVSGHSAHVFRALEAIAMPGEDVLAQLGEQIDRAGSRRSA